MTTTMATTIYTVPEGCSKRNWSKEGRKEGVEELIGVARHAPIATRYMPHTTYKHNICFLCSWQYA